MRGIIRALLLAGALSLAGAAPASAAERRPVLFVHGIEGTGAQFQSQALRLTSNGYPHDWIDTVDYDSTRAAAESSEVDAQIDAKIAALKQRTGAAKVDVVAHSLGTIVMQGYLTDSAQGEARRANVARYVNVDGQADNPGVPTLAIWAGRRDGEPESMPEAQNVTIPNQTHVQVCTSLESFKEVFRFLTGESPAHGIVAQHGKIEVAGRALSFPMNQGLAGATVQVWPLDDAGRRSASAPAATATVTDGARGAGDWGPLALESGRPYEFALVRAGSATLHIYYEPFVRSDYTLRLLASDALRLYTGGRAGSMSTVNIRYKELWADVPGETDVLSINGTNICTTELCPWTKQVNAFFAFDRNRDGQTDLSPDPVVGALPFIQGADVFIPATAPASKTTTFQLSSRGGPVRTIRTLDWDSSSDGVTIQWSDFEPAEVVEVTPATTAAPACQARRTVTLRVPVARGARVRRIVAYDGKRRVGRSSGSRRVRVRVTRRNRATVTVRLRVTTVRGGRTRTATLRRSVRLCRR